MDVLAAAEECGALIWSRVRQSIEQLLVLKMNRDEPRPMIIFGTFRRCGCEFADGTPLCLPPLNKLRPYTLFHDSCQVVRNDFDVVFAPDEPFGSGRPIG